VKARLIQFGGAHRQMGQRSAEPFDDANARFRFAAGSGKQVFAAAYNRPSGPVLFVLEVVVGVVAASTPSGRCWWRRWWLPR